MLENENAADKIWVSFYGLSLDATEDQLSLFTEFT